MDWDEMIKRLTAAGVPAGRLPVRDRRGGVIDLVREGDQWIVASSERWQWLPMGAFIREEDAVAYIFDERSFAEDMDERCAKRRRGDRSVPLPRPEDHGGVSLDPYWNMVIGSGRTQKQAEELARRIREEKRWPPGY